MFRTFLIAVGVLLWASIASAQDTGWTRMAGDTRCSSTNGAGCDNNLTSGVRFYDFTGTTDPPILSIGDAVDVVSIRLNPDTTGGGATGCEVQAYRCDAGGTFSTTTCPSKILWDVSQPADTVLDDVTIDGTSSPDLRAGADFVAVRYLGFDVTANGSGDSCRITVEGH